MIDKVLPKLQLNQPCCYLLKLSKPLGNEKHSAQYYLGSCKNLEDRLQKHRSGNGAAFLKAAKEKNITFNLIRVWHTDTLEDARLKEVQLKRRKNHKHLVLKES